jgi:hypothetical protein
MPGLSAGETLWKSGNLPLEKAYLVLIPSLDLWSFAPPWRFRDILSVWKARGVRGRG